MFMMNLRGPATTYEVQRSRNVTYDMANLLISDQPSQPTDAILWQSEVKPPPAPAPQLPQPPPSPPQVYQPPAPMPPPLDQPSPGTIVYPTMAPTALPQISSMLPKWALILAGGGTVLGLLALVLLRRR